MYLSWYFCGTHPASLCMTFSFLWRTSFHWTTLEAFECIIMQQLLRFYSCTHSLFVHFPQRPLVVLHPVLLFGPQHFSAGNKKCVKLLRRHLKLVQLWYVIVFNMRSFNSWSLKWTFEELQVFNSLVKNKPKWTTWKFPTSENQISQSPAQKIRRHSTKLNTQCSHQLFICFLKIAHRYR